MVTSPGTDSTATEVILSPSVITTYHCCPDLLMVHSGQGATVKHIFDLGPQSRGVASKSIPSARVSSALSSAINLIWFRQEPTGFSTLCSIFINNRSLTGKDSDVLEHKYIVHSDNIDIVNPLSFELLVGAYVAGDLRSACPGECAR